MKRRSFLGALLAAGMSPAIVKASSLMPIKAPAIWTPWHQNLSQYGDFSLEGIYNDKYLSDLRFSHKRKFSTQPTPPEVNLSEWKHITVIVGSAPAFYVNGLKQVNGPSTKGEQKATDILLSTMLPYMPPIQGDITNLVVG